MHINQVGRLTAAQSSSVATSGAAAVSAIGCRTARRAQDSAAERLAMEITANGLRDRDV